MLLAVDAGATKTEALVYDGSISGLGVSGSGNHNAVGPEAAEIHVAAAIKGALEMAGCTWNDVTAAYYGFAGADAPGRSRKVVEDIIGRLHGAGSKKLYNDGVAAYYLSALGRDGVVAAAGTGSVVHARNGERKARAGGWGWFVGDEGSAFWIGRAALNAATLAFDGRGSETALVSAIEGRMGEQFTDAVSRFQGFPSVCSVASLAPLVTASAASGDAVSASICRQAGSALASGVRAAARAVGLEGDFTIGAVGGVFRGGAVITDSFTGSLKDMGGTFAPVYFGSHVVAGAVLMYLEEKGTEISPGLAAGLVAQIDALTGRIGRDARRRYLFLP